jgi:hypothetical protein
LKGAYGLTASTKKVARPHIYLTVKKGMKKSDVRSDLEDKFKCNAKLYFELLPECKQKPKIKYLGKSASKLRSKFKKSPSSRPTPGGGILACIRNSSEPLRMAEETERHDLPVVQGAGTLTMFCAGDNEHYALTCFHVGCATGETQLNATLNKKEDIQAIRSSLQNYVQHAREQEYHFVERDAEKTNNEPIVYGDDGRNYTPLGDFHEHQFDSTCDIMFLKVPRNTKIDCKIKNVTPPNWDNIGKELYERVYDCNTVTVEKTGFSSGLTHGRIIPCDFSINLEGESLFQDAYIVKGYSGPFLEGGDSGSPVFFHDNNDQKQVFAYGVCEIDEIPEIKWLVSDDTDSSSETILDGYDSEVEFQEESVTTGPYHICLRLDTALEKQGLLEATCLNKCSLRRS